MEIEFSLENLKKCYLSHTLSNFIECKMSKLIQNYFKMEILVLIAFFIILNRLGSSVPRHCKVKKYNTWCRDLKDVGGKH